MNTWHHIAVVKNNGTLTVYVNGQNVYSASDSTNYSSLTNLAVGGVYSSAYLFHGYIDDFRITK
ncbi:MAG TPA: LamG domain-containing protein [bacterium]|nr:LamG domain-containing protein [bacterium]